MKTQFLLISMLLLCACRTTTAGPKERVDMSKTSAAQPEMLLQKIIGGWDEEEKKEKDQYFECKVMSDIPEAADVKKWIAELSGDLVMGYHIVATSPSIQLYAFRGSEKKTLYKDQSQIEKAKEETAVEALRKIIEKYCPTPNKTK
ncbi:hypothetical protein [Oligoflexus tunisiensis]|uniref:hypothetical protein n=1 Tax=Oligoflexus tunisiensis TaxID=708132 RepID=UPI00114D1978|nr:hypothetical protein [Oligoflexus tunisiensis]